ncbi:MAG: YihY/virulence factor BrkB family protein [Bacteroidales bacterium]
MFANIKKSVGNSYQKISNFLKNEVWEIDLSNFSKKRAKAIKYLRVSIVTSKNFGEQNLGWKSVALSFFSTMAFIPMIAILFTVTYGFGMDKMLRTMIYEIANNDYLVDVVTTFADNIITTAKQGPMGIISFLVFAWVVIWLLLCVEKSFNTIWRVEKSRVIWKRILTNILIIILSPFILILFMFMFLTISKGMDSIGLDIPFIESVSTIILWLIFYIFATLLFTALYVLIPNAKVKFVPALKSALLTALAFTIIQYLYLETQVFVARLNAVYGVFGAIPLFMIWMNIGWYIILLGAEITYAYQHIDYYDDKSAKLLIPMSVIHEKEMNKQLKKEHRQEKRQEKRKDKNDK